MIGTFKKLIGIDNLASEYAYGRDASTGYTSAKKIPQKWVATTCGYCSVGCGIEVGVRDGKAIAARPLAASRMGRLNRRPTSTAAAPNNTSRPIR